MKIKDLLIKNKLITKRIQALDNHLRLLNRDVEELKMKYPRLKNKSNEEISNYVVSIYNKCDATHPDFDSLIYEETLRFTLKTNSFPGGRYPSGWNNELYIDDGYGFISESSSIYDDYIDSMADDEIKHHK